MLENVVFLQQGRQPMNAWAVQNKLSNDTSNILEVQCVNSLKDTPGTEGSADFCKKVLDALEDMGTEMRNIKVRVTRIEIDVRNIQDTKSNQRCSEFMRKTLDKM